MRKWLHDKGNSYEFIGGLHSDEDTEPIEDNHLIKAQGSTYSPYSSNSQYVPVQATKKRHWCMRPSACCVSCLFCIKDKERLNRSSLLIRWKVASAITFILLLLIGA